MFENIRFGVAGYPPNFWHSKYNKNRINALEWLYNIGLNALELQCTYGIKMPKEKALDFRSEAERWNIELSIHAPYYISLASPNKDVVMRSKERIIKAFELASWLGSNKIIFHPGSATTNRSKAIHKIVKALNEIQKEIEPNDIRIYPEIAGKTRQLGSLDEIIEICQQVDIARPCIDFAHLHARDEGSLINEEDFISVFKKLEKGLGSSAIKSLHCHFYPVAWGQNGEIGHKSFKDKVNPKEQEQLFELAPEAIHYYPRFEPFISAIIKYGIAPTIICEAKDSQDEGAILMKKEYYKLKETYARSSD